MTLSGVTASTKTNRSGPIIEVFNVPEEYTLPDMIY